MEGQVQVPLPQVFVNFRGAELRDNFVRNLVWALKDSGINVFIDDHERKGKEIKGVFTRIKRSKIALAIFSERYCESKWCLEELVRMNKQMEEKKLVMIPIFFNVSADEVKRAADPNRKSREGVPDGKFTVLFKQMKQEYKEESERVERWECALKSVTKIFGFSPSNYRNEFEFVAGIVREVKRQLHMPIETELSNGDVAFLALFLNLIFSFIIAPMVFPDLKFFQTPKWCFLGFPGLVIAWHIWYKKNQNKAHPPS